MAGARGAALCFRGTMLTLAGVPHERLRPSPSLVVDWRRRRRARHRRLRRRRRPSGTCRPPTRRTTSTPRTCSSSPTTSTRRPAASSRSPCTPTRRCSRRPRSSARSRAARRRSARCCSSTTRTSGSRTASTACPFLADSYAESMKLYKASKPALEKKLGEQGMMLLYTVPWPPQGIYVNKPINSRRRPEGRQVARLQPGDGARRRAGRRAAGHGAGGRAVAGDGDRRRRELHVVGLDRLRHQDLRAHQVLVRHAGVAAEERGARQQGGVRRARQGDAGGASSRPAPTPKRAAGRSRRRRTASTSSC